MTEMVDAPVQNPVTSVVWILFILSIPSKNNI